MGNYRVTRPVWCNPVHGYIGRIPKSSEGGKNWARAASFIRTQQRAYQEFAYSGPPGTTEHTNPKDGDFYVILRDYPNYDGKTQRGHNIQFLTWGGRAAETAQEVLWFSDFDKAATELELFSRAGGDAQKPDDWGDRSSGVFVSKEVHSHIKTYEDSSARFTLGKISIQNTRIAALSVWACPQYGYEDGREVCPEWDCGVGDLIIGSDGYNGDSTKHALGGARRYVCHGATMALDTAEVATRRCLFQTGHPAGWYTSENAAFQHLHGNFRFPVYPRNTLRCAENDTRTVSLSPAFVVLAATPGAAVKYTIGSETVTWLCTSEITTPSLVCTDAVDDRTIDPIVATTWDNDERYCDIEIIASSESASEEILIATVSLWENGPYTNVVDD